MLTDSLNTTRLICTAVSAILLYYVVQALWVNFTSALRSFPGPWHTRFTGLGIKINTLLGQRCFYIHALHRKYGPIVRVAPSEIDICELDAFREIHRIANGFQKTKWYTKFTPGIEDNVFAMTDNQEHAARRKLLARAFSNSSLLANFQPIVMDRAKLAVQQIKKEAASGDSDILKWWTLMATDVTAQVAFGKASKMLESGKKTTYVENLSTLVQATGIRAEGAIFYNLLRLFSPRKVANFDRALKDVPTYGLAAVRETKSSNLESFNIISGMIKESMSEKSHVTEFGLASQASAIIIAGSDTTATTLTYAVWAVLSHPTVRKRLEAEVLGLPDVYDQISLEALPYLNAVITETLRLYGAAPGSLPRVHQSKPLQAGKYLIPPGTVVSTQAWTIHRDPSIFPEPDR
ncbi:sterigmatocystin biosynthesis P450 monooxygenase [Aspergillus carlsbadensis]|nr:sterigmatocystin biosynthesis P450 monooxygenase [Aspergillus carlsbadensis]